jgi:hypothetical protein
MGDPPIKKSRKSTSATKATFNLKDAASNPRSFLFVVGGLSHHEIVSISNLQHECASQIIPGSNEVYSVKEYIDQMEILNKPDSIKDFIR